MKFHQVRIVLGHQTLRRQTPHQIDNPKLTNAIFKGQITEYRATIKSFRGPDRKLTVSRVRGKKIRK